MTVGTTGTKPQKTSKTKTLGEEDDLIVIKYKGAVLAPLGRITRVAQSLPVNKRNDWSPGAFCRCFNGTPRTHSSMHVDSICPDEVLVTRFAMASTPAVLFGEPGPFGV